MEKSKIGWFTTGRDLEAVNLLKIIYQGIEDKTIDGYISFIFLNREQGEGLFSDKIIEMARGWNIPVLCLSSSKFKPRLRKQAWNNLRAMEKWRQDYHSEVFQMVSFYKPKISILAGYMLIVSQPMCEELNLINLHPAPPDGPQGTWQEVIWELISTKADKSGVTIHKVTPELDKGPPIAYCFYKIKGKEFSILWNRFNKQLKRMSIQEIITEEGEENALFKRIRKEGVKRERPLLFETIRTLSSGELEIKRDKIFFKGKEQRGGICFNKKIDRLINF